MIKLTLLLIFLTFIFKPLIIFMIPGILILFTKQQRNKTILEKISLVVFLSLAFWITFFWYLRIINFNFEVTMWIVFIITSLLALYLSSKVSLPTKKTFIPVIVFIILVALRLVPIFVFNAPSGVDTTMHTYITRLIVEHNGIPNSFRPFVEHDEFGSYSAGFHTMSAQLALLSNIEPHRSVFISGSLLLVFVVLSLFLFLRYWKVSETKSLFVSSLATLLSLNPQLISIWGGYPTILSFTFGILSITFFLKIMKDANSENIFLFSIFTTASFLSHSLVFIGLISILASMGIIKLYYMHKNNFKEFLQSVIQSIIISVVMLLPFLINFDPRTPDAGREYARNWVPYLWSEIGSITSMIFPNSSLLTGIFDIFISLPLYSFGMILLTIFAYSVIVKRKLIKKREQAFTLAIFIPLSLLLLISRFELFSFFYAIYPERISLFIYLPLVLIISKINLKKAKSIALIIIILTVINFSLMSQNDFRNHYFEVRTGEISIPKFLFNEAFFGNYFIYSFSGDQNTLTDEDFEAMLWMRDNLEDAFIKNPYNDAGKWIPGIVGFPIVNTHSNPFMYDKTQLQSTYTNYTHIYLGSKQPGRLEIRGADYSGFELNNSLELIYSSGNSKLYKVLRNYLD